MTVTEEQAKKKWCPQSIRAISLTSDAGGCSMVAASGNRFDNGIPKGTLCIGSSCMVWRWDQRSKHDGGFPGSEAPTAAWKGYCGLAGKP